MNPLGLRPNFGAFLPQTPIILFGGYCPQKGGYISRWIFFHTCKDIDPSEAGKRSAEFSEVLSKYDKAVNWNFIKRVERFEDKQSGEKHGKDLDYAEYSEWLAKLREFREQWKNTEIGDEEILKVIHELD